MRHSNAEQIDLWDAERTDARRPEGKKLLRFDGETFDPAQDRDRLAKQMTSVYQTMRDGVWRTLEEIEGLVHAPQASISARLRDLRKPRFGAHTVERRRRGEGTRGLFEYRVIRENSGERSAFL